MTQTTKIVVEEVRILSWCICVMRAYAIGVTKIAFYQDEDAPPKLTQRELEDLERAEKEAQQKRVYFDIFISFNSMTAILNSRTTSPL